MADMAMVCKAVAQTLTQAIPYINQQMALSGPQQLQTVLDYYKADLDGKSYPAIMLNHIKEEHDWWALQDIYGSMFSVDIYAMLRGNGTPETMDRQIDRLAGAIKDVLGEKNLYMPCDNGQTPVFVDFNKKGYFPVQTTQYLENAPGESMLTRGAKMRWKGTFCQQATDQDVFLAVASNEFLAQP